MVSPARALSLAGCLTRHNADNMIAHYRPLWQVSAWRNMEDRKLRSALRASFTIACLLAIATVARSEHLPIKTYTTADGLARDSINRIVRDSRGFLWFCTSEGLSRFDGYRFTSYGIEEGLPNRNVKDLLETRDGLYWIAMAGGVCRFNPMTYSPTQAFPRADLSPTSEPRFVAYRPSRDARGQSVNAMIEDRAGNIWCGTESGLYRLEQVEGQWTFNFVDIGLPAITWDDTIIHALLEDSRGELWIGAGSGLYRRFADGRVERYTKQDMPYDVRALLEDKEGRLWAGTTNGLRQVVFHLGSNHPVIARVYTMKDGLLSNHVSTLFQSSDGNLWIGGFGLSVFISTTGNLRNYTTDHGLSSNSIRAMAEDRDGNLWMGSESGAMKMARNGLTTYGEADGLDVPRIAAIFEGQEGQLYTLTVTKQPLVKPVINRLDGKRFTAAVPNLPDNVPNSWGWYQITFQDSAGEWWVPTAKGLFRYPKVRDVEQLARARPKAVYTRKDGLSGDEIFRLFEDSRGDIWISTLGDSAALLTRWERATGTFHRYLKADNILPAAPTAFCEDGRGNLWIGYYTGGLMRYAAGQFTVLTPVGGLSEDFIRGLYLDRSGRLWVATGQGGLIRIDDPGADSPRFVTYTMAEGLSSNQITCITEDQWGRLYIGTGRGLDRLDPTTGRIRHYTVADGLGHGLVNVSFRDRAGALWFGTTQGLSRMIPEPDQPRPPTPVLISGLRIAGLTYPVSDLGEINIPPLELGAGQNQIEIDFFGISFGLGEAIRYQYKLEGSDQDWKPLTDQRTVNYASLAPGAYRFVVQAVSADGSVSLLPATIDFHILPPVWLRWWFLTLVGVLIAATVFAVDRYRAARMKEVKAALAQSTMLTIRLAVKQEDLRRANRTLALEYAVTSILTESPTVNDAAPKILQAICESAGWEIGELWDVDSQAGVLRCVDVWHMEMKDAAEFERHSKETTFPPGVGLPGRVLALGEPLWITDLAADTNFPRMPYAVKEGLRSGFGFPILLGNEVLGVLEFFSRETRKRDEDLLDTVSSIGSHIGQLLERKRAEQKLRESESRFRTLAETASDAIITIDDRSTIIFVNQAAETVFGYTVSEMLGRDLTMLMPEYLRHLHRNGFSRYMETGQRHLSWEAIELPGLHKSGREIPLEISFGEFTRNDRHFSPALRAI